MTHSLVDTSKIPGWGVDADPQNDPTYPYRDRSQDDHSSKWERPPLQESDVEVLRSIEHVRRPAVFGTSTPPRGLSGMIRRGAFTYSESHWFHWLMLMGADRINVVEGVIEDLARGKVPNIPAEMGIKSEWEHNKTGLAKKVAVTAAVAGVGYALFRWARSGRGEDEGREPRRRVSAKRESNAAEKRESIKLPEPPATSL
ncbi:MAG TPA: hypothetical protein VEZ20_06105 [Allosphingosinicella sp.]|jgi:hypothetical protein|nr:hypothetical protein [Allosphingosinicella sp.]